MFLSFGIYGILRKQPEISVPKIHKLIMLILKQIRSFATMTPAVVRQPHTASQSSSAHPEPIQRLNLPEILQAALMHLLRNPSERRMDKDLLHFKGPTCKQVISANWWPVCCHQHPSGYHQLIFPMRTPGRDSAVPGGLHMDPSPLLLLYWDSGGFLATIPTLFVFNYLRCIEALLKIQI